MKHVGKRGIITTTTRGMAQVNAPDHFAQLYSPNIIKGYG